MFEFYSSALHGNRSLCFNFFPDSLHVALNILHFALVWRKDENYYLLNSLLQHKYMQLKWGNKMIFRVICVLLSQEWHIKQGILCRVSYCTLKLYLFNYLILSFFFFILLLSYFFSGEQWSNHWGQTQTCIPWKLQGLTRWKGYPCNKHYMMTLQCNKHRSIFKKKFCFSYSM